jgi:hypothetical protein
METMNLKDLKFNMWIEVCEGDDDIKMSKEYKKLISDIGNEEVSGCVYILNFYKLLNRLIENELIEDIGGEMDWIYNDLSEYGEEDNFNKYYDEYLELIK